MGPLTENYVLQQLQPGQFPVEPRYYADKTREIDFCPAKPEWRSCLWKQKAGRTNQHRPSNATLPNIIPKMRSAFRGSVTGKDGEFTNLPLYLACKTKSLL